MAFHETPALPSWQERLDLHGMRGMRTIAVINQKGGTGKTTTCVNLAATLGERRRNVLLIDIDPQHSSTTWYLPAGAGQPRSGHRSTPSLPGWSPH
jgi:Mrp family chromosome partitioning ATPase